MDVIKSTGETEKFSEEKIYKTSKRAGASDDLAQKTVEEVKKTLEQGMSTDEIYDNVLSCLIDNNSAVAARYSLKKSIMKLGPAGYIFEKYIAAILREYGYETRTGIIVKGECVHHEVDVLAKKDTRHILAECKYHNHRGIKTGVKVSMYTYARSADIIERMERVETEKNTTHEGWLITNTHCSDDAIKFATCRGLKILSWNYPKKNSLREYIEKKALYPVTIIPKMPKRALKKLSDENIMFAHEVAHIPLKKFMSISGLKKNQAENIQREVLSICKVGD